MDEQGKRRTLAQQLDTLFKTVQPLRREFTYEEVARGCTEAGQGTFSKTYVWQLRTGQRENPTKRHLEALATFFGVPPAYFFDDSVATRVDSQLALATALRDSEVRDVALRMMRMDDTSRQSVARIVQEVMQVYTARSGEPTDPEQRQQGTPRGMN
ncbi:helix-turn-helix domain-containing protein [Actinacidiphila acididurans]|uniref:Helix-turn-helix transcriptional regulator n=1 Tax=Actinacidiphila acididurans TaxID=2784346 RepID=A0ABS2TTP8_9ACTN|nr:helix-turn-helix domain-containing protein [Actinacidiphila acididurans]MBM9506710.1 helix-turn-helix transcriptional regulator [Actinacidiphila acididurans]